MSDHPLGYCNKALYPRCMFDCYEQHSLPEPQNYSKHHLTSLHSSHNQIVSPTLFEAVVV